MFEFDGKMLICRSMNNSEEFEQELYDGLDVWDDIYDDDIEKSNS